ncbi:MAG: hypothetical protein ACD_37C00574G0002 [uncultured bacterium]|nr:MAG: hypothetical protein ACD_37C00574G0002 [uncultured bacterium]
MLPRKTITKRQKKEASKKKLGTVLVFIGLFMIALSLFFTAYLEKKPKPLSPLSKNQKSVNTAVEESLKKKNISFQSIDTANDLSIVVKLDKNKEVVIDPDKDIGEQLSSLQLIIAQLKIEGKSFKRLDFRYQKPIITF